MKRESNKVILYSILVAVAIMVATIGLIIYGESSKKSEMTQIDSNEMAELIDKANLETETANADIGKDITEVEEELSKIELKSEEKEIEQIEEKQEEVIEEAKVEEKQEVEEQVKELEFEMPVVGELLRGFAKESLIYSETLQEWVTHLGIDILANKTTVVKSAEEGTVKLITNDPRYGLTVVIEHSQEYQTVYSNLLTSEFIVEGEKVEKGQSIATVGNSAAFEIADDPHLHFEVWKNGEAIDPLTVLK